jgi:hypothetical protein
MMLLSGELFALHYDHPQLSAQVTRSLLQRDGRCRTCRPTTNHHDCSTIR